jgi:hypothetical protein
VRITKPTWPQRKPLEHGDFIWPSLKAKLMNVSTVRLPKKLSTATLYFECPCQYYSRWLVIGFLWWIWFFGTGEIPEEFKP